MSTTIPTLADIPALLQRAVALHQQGALELAEPIYRRVLSAQPDHFDALHLLGVIARQRGDSAQAIGLISQAIAIDPNHAIAHCNLGASLQDQGDSLLALTSYERAITLNPAYAMAFNNRGNALKNLGRHAEALASYARALTIQPAYAEALHNQAIVLQLEQQLTAALDSFARALKIKPAYSDAAYGRAVTLFSLQRYTEAIHAYDLLLALKPDHAEGHVGLGVTLYRLQQFDAALHSFRRAIECCPGYARAWQLQGNTLRALGRFDEAASAYQKALESGGDAQQLHYALAALGIGAIPSSSPRQYVVDLFDQYAARFDQHLLEVLHYDTPRMLAELLDPYRIGTEADTLDLGCGTGLCAAYLKPYSRTLTGVDLSQKMLEQAANRHLYDRLACADLIDFLEQTDAAFDLIVAADVFVYIGDLTPVFRGVHRVLRDGGVFSFSVERHDGADFHLQRSTRYAHSMAYLQRLADAHGFHIREAVSCVTRQDNGQDIPAFALVLNRGT